MTKCLSTHASKKTKKKEKRTLQGPTLGSRQVEKRHCRRRCLVRAVPLKAGDACGRWKTLLRFLPGADRERVLLAPENALFISLG